MLQDFMDFAHGPRHQTSVWQDALGRRNLGTPVHIGSNAFKHHRHTKKNMTKKFEIVETSKFHQVSKEFSSVDFK